MAKSQKGSKFERDFCKKLSEWWCPGRDDLFWRTAGSGARAKVRGRQGKSTANQSGDICATDPIGQPVIDYLCFELKRGYGSSSIQDLLDKPNQDTCLYRQWIKQARESTKQAGAKHWCIVLQRDRRIPLVLISKLLMVKICPERFICFQSNGVCYYLLELDSFLNEVKGKIQ